MARAKKAQEKPVQTRAEKRDAAKNLIKELLQKGDLKASALIDEAAKEYTKRFQGEDTENPNDVKGRIGSVLDVMKKDGDVAFEGGVYALKANLSPVEEEKSQEETKKKTTKKTTSKKSAKTLEKQEEKAEEMAKIAQETQEKPAKKTARKKKEPLPAAPILPNAPVAPTTPENEPEPIKEETVKEEKPAPKKRAKKAVKVQEKTQETTQEQPIEKAEEKPEEQPVQQSENEQKQEKIEQPKGTLMDVSFLLGASKPLAVKTEQQPEQKERKQEVKAEEKPAQKAEQKTQVKPEKQALQTRKLPQTKIVKAVKKPLTADEKLQAAFLAKLHRLGGDYFEYYSVYLLEKYSRQNGRRLEGLRITSGDRDGGIDGEIELTDRLGFRETIYIQSKNWDPDKGDEKLWVVGETLLQQFIGACACRQAKDGKQHCRGIFITTSRFTPDAKRLLDVMSDKIVGYDGADLYETAKECQFGLIKKNGEWALDEALLSGEKAFFQIR